MKKRIGELLFQIIPVMIGVYLGFLATDWSDKKQKREQSDLLIKNILVEIDTNEERLKSVIDYHIMLRDSSRHYSDSRTKIAQTNFFEGTRLTKLTNSAYHTGMQTGIINELKIDNIQAINQLYTFQNDYNEFGNLMMASLINKDFSDKEEDIRKIARFLAVTMTDIIIKENDLIKGYNSLKKKLQD